MLKLISLLALVCACVQANGISVKTDTLVGMTSSSEKVFFTTISDSTCFVTDIDGRLGDGNVVIDTIYYRTRKYAVVGLGDTLFGMNLQLKSLTLGKSVRYVGRKVACLCPNLIRVEFLGNVDNVSEGAFEYCVNLKNVVFHGKVKLVGEFSFSSCSALEEVRFCSTVDSIADMAFGLDTNVYVSFPNPDVKLGFYPFDMVKGHSKVNNANDDKESTATHTDHEKTGVLIKKESEATEGSAVDIDSKTHIIF